MEKQAKSLVKMELGLYFIIGAEPFDPDRDDEAEYAVARAAWETINEKLWNLPGVITIFDYHGNETQVESPESFRQLRVELCELSGENKVIDGRLAYGFHFYSSKEIDLSLAQSLKQFCEAELTDAANHSGLPLSFAKAEVYKEWIETERHNWAEV